MIKKTLILLPTYNEEKNILELFKKLKSLKLNFVYLFINDSSSDKTYEILKELKKKNKKNFILFHRQKRMGIGKAHKDGLIWAFKKKFSYVITMDTDLTHDPIYIPKILRFRDKFDVIVGSRYLRRNSTPSWSYLRIILSNGAYLMSRMLFNLNVDTTNGFRLYNLNRLKKSFIKKCKSNDYDFFYTSLVFIKLNKNTIGQIPMILKKRYKGVSKMYFKHVLKSIFNMFVLYLRIKN